MHIRWVAMGSQTSCPAEQVVAKMFLKGLFFVQHLIWVPFNIDLLEIDLELLILLSM